MSDPSFSYSINTGAQRSGTITVRNSNNSSCYTTITVTQAKLNITNLIYNGNAEKIDYWFESGGGIDSTNKFTFNSGCTAMITQSNSTINAGPIANHVYYGRCYQYAPSGSSYPDGRFEWYLTDSSTGKITFAQMADTGGAWKMASARASISSPTSGTWYIRNFTVSGTAVAYRKECMIIDLTAIFGSGNEPTQAWCDSNLSYVSNTQEETYTESVVRYTSTSTITLPSGMRYVDMFLVNGGNGGSYITGYNKYTHRGEGGNVYSAPSANIYVSNGGSMSITIGAAGIAGTKSSKAGGTGGTTSVVINGTTYSPSSQPANSNSTGGRGTDGTANPFGKIGSDTDSNLYGASGAAGRISNYTPYYGGTTGGGTGGTVYGTATLKATAGSFYGAGGGGGSCYNYAWVDYPAAPAAGYQGCAILRFENKT